MTYYPQVPPKRSGLRPVHWVLLGVGGVIVLFCGLCGIVGVIGSGADPAPSASVVAETRSAGATTAGATTAGAPSASAAPVEATPGEATSAGTTGAPLIGDDVVEDDASADADTARKAVPEAAPTTRRPVPAAPAAPAATPRRTTKAPAPAKTTSDSGSDSGSVYYKNCAEARAANAAPLYRGEPGYRDALDGDKDGDACE